MTFLQPWFLAAMPLLALPVVIHLIHQRRYQTVPWAAMRFLLAAHRAARSFARIRQWLVLVCRMAAVAAIVLAASRPLTSGRWGAALDRRSDASLVLVDRSPSMAEQDVRLGESKLRAGLRQLARLMAHGRSDRWIVFDSATRRAERVTAPDRLLEPREWEPVSSSADIPGLLERACHYIQTQRLGPTDIWICSDLRRADWQPDSGRWTRVRQTLKRHPAGVRLYLLVHGRAAGENVSVRVRQARCRPTPSGNELSLSLAVRRIPQGASPGHPLPRTVPLAFEIQGVRFVHPLEMTADETELHDHRIALPAGVVSGWGVVVLPADANPADNRAYFVFDRPAPRKTLIVADDPAVARTLELAASSGPDPDLDYAAQRIEVDQLAARWDESVGLILWQAPLPSGPIAQLVDTFLDRGGQFMAFPPDPAGGPSWRGVRWAAWHEVSEPPVGTHVVSWRMDEDLLANTLSGRALPLGQLVVRRVAPLEGNVLSLATLSGDHPLLARQVTRRGGVYFWTTSPAANSSNLAEQGVVLYVAVQRALAAGADALGRVRQLEAVPLDPDTRPSAPWQALCIDHQAPPSQYRCCAGVYQAGEYLMAVNRPASEDEQEILSDGELDRLLDGLDTVRFEQQAADHRSLVHEIWHVCLTMMLLALLLEAALCLPRSARRPRPRSGRDRSASGPWAPPSPRQTSQPDRYPRAHGLWFLKT